MPTISNIANLVACGLSATLGTGTKGCVPRLKKAYSLWVTPQGFEFDGSETLNSTYVNQLKAEGNLIILKGIRAFTDNTPDDDIETFEDGTKDVAKLGFYEFALNFASGLHFNAALNSLNSFGNFDISIVDVDGNVFGTKTANGSFKGFTVGMFHSQKLMWATDTTVQREGLMMQLLERSEVDTDYVFIQRKQLGSYNPKIEEGVNEVELTWDSLPAAGTTVTVVAKLKQDGSAFTGIDFNDFILKANGVTANPTAGNDTAKAGTYVLTVPAISSNDDLELSLYDNSNSRAGIAVDGDTYKSNTLTATVV